MEVQESCETVLGEQQPAEEPQQPAQVPTKVLLVRSSTTAQRVEGDIDIRPEELLSKTGEPEAGGRMGLVKGGRYGVERGKLSVLVDELDGYRVNVRRTIGE